MEQRITWNDSGDGSGGRVGKVDRLFVITYRTNRKAPTWTLQIRLPVRRDTWQHDDRDVLKEIAEEAFAAYLVDLLGHLPGPLTTAERMRADAYQQRINLESSI